MPCLSPTVSTERVPFAFLMRSTFSSHCIYYIALYSRCDAICPPSLPPRPEKKRYTVFQEANESGMPMMRPMWVQYPEDIKTFDMDDQVIESQSLSLSLSSSYRDSPPTPSSHLPSPSPSLVTFVTTVFSPMRRGCMLDPLQLATHA